MGQSKINADRNKALESALLSCDIERVSNAIIKLASAASDRLGMDCYLHAAMGQFLLSQIGVETSIESGYSAWRVGNGDGDVILHRKTDDMVEQPGAIPFHSWLSCGRYIIDFTTYLLPHKAKLLDQLDGGNTDVIWFPPYLMTLKDESKPMIAVQQDNAGLFNYTRDKTIESFVKAKSEELDDYIKNNLMIIFENPNINVTLIKP